MCIDSVFRDRFIKPNFKFVSHKQDIGKKKHIKITLEETISSEPCATQKLSLFHPILKSIQCSFPLLFFFTIAIEGVLVK